MNFSLENWDFGETFYFSELSAYVMNQLAPDLTTFVIVPRMRHKHLVVYMNQPKAMKFL